MTDTRTGTGPQAAIDGREYRCGIARIDNQRTAVVAGKRPDVVVAEGFDGVQLRHGMVLGG